MKRTVILSTNDDPKYFHYLKWCQLAWKKCGWDTLTFYYGSTKLENAGEYLTDSHNEMVDLSGESFDYRDETIVQCIRLLGGNYIMDGLVMLGDVDMLPMQNYWNPNPDQITSYGYDLTGRSEIPMCYVSAPAAKWRRLFPENSLIELLDKLPNAKSDDWNLWWSVDQQVLTKRLKTHGIDCFVDRGLVGGLARGRVDRYDWAGTLNQPGEKIDAHMPRPYDELACETIISMIIKK